MAELLKKKKVAKIATKAVKKVADKKDVKKIAKKVTKKVLKLELITPPTKYHKNQAA